MDEIKKKKISTKDKLMEETINNLVETEDEIFADEDTIKVVEFEMDNEIVEGVIYNMPREIKKSFLLIRTKEDIADIEGKKENERDLIMSISTEED